MEKPNLTQIIYDLKASFRKKFHDKELSDSVINLINEAAKKVKKGFVAEWYEDNGVKIKFTQFRRYYVRPEANQPYGKKSNSTGHTHK